MKFKPLQDWILIEREDPKEKTVSGIIIPESAQDKPTEGVVLAVGPGRYKVEEDKGKEKKFIPTVLKPGQRIMYGKYSVREIEAGNETFIMVREEDVLGIIEESPMKEGKSSATKEVKTEKATPVRKTAGESKAKKESTKKTKK